MALFDFFRRRRPAADSSRPRGSGGITGFLNRIFGRRRTEPEPEPEPIYPEPEPELEPDEFIYEEPEADIIIDDSYVETFQPPQIEEAPIEAGQITDLSDQELLDKYQGMLDKMVERGYIDSFDNDADAAEFLRVLSSQAWEEAHGYWYSVEALSQIQDAVARGAKAGTLQSNYNLQIEKKSNNYLKTWEEWIQ